MDILRQLRHEQGKAHDFTTRRPGKIKLLRGLSALLPGEYLKTAFYLNCIDRPRRALREALFAFYRYDHVYAVLREFGSNYPGRFSVLEFGTADGYSFVKLLYATHYLKLADRVIVHTFDSFEGLPAAVDERDRDLVAGDDWVQGQYRGNYAALQAYCAPRYENYEIHRGYFEQTLDQPFLSSLREYPPVLVWIDCDYYSSSRTVLERLINHLPNGCVIYFDELDNMNFGSRLTGEARLVAEINTGLFGEGIELVPDTRLSLQSRRIYRFIRLPANRMLLQSDDPNAADQVRRRSDGSPLP
ncbi:MAG TPA: class I SAM-dependent methyltransferase [Steroidobacteraceae bacterium]|nr:class I SAM-dependent methyltransferase [Steroidobacteraceae bacterium]